MSQLNENKELYRQLFVNDTPMLDLRAPVEFAQGAFAHSVNLPLLSDDERAEVGTCYKQHGQPAAIELGHKIVSGSVKQQRIQLWKDFVEQHPHGYLYCFRGGLRSRTVQSSLRAENIEYPLIPGGYKAMRRFLIDETQRITKTVPFMVISGFTGTGKTKLLERLTNAIDLEGLANHRGSSFGNQLTAQPSQINFENNLAVALLKQTNLAVTSLIFEDESRLIGSRSLPIELHQKMQQSPLVLLDEPFENRLNIIYQEYIVERYKYLVERGEPEPQRLLSEYLITAIDKIQKRLGSERHLALRKLIEQAMESNQSDNQFEQFRECIKILLQEYYDPMYHYQLSKKHLRIAFKGNADEIIEFLHNQDD